MAHRFGDIKAAVLIILNQSTKVRNFYDYEEPKPAGYPAIMVTAAESESIFLDTVRNREEFGLQIRCMQERVEVGASESERIMTNLVDEIMSIFTSTTNFTIGNTAVFAYPVGTKWGYQSSPDVDVRMCDIGLRVVVAQ